MKAISTLLYNRDLMSFFYEVADLRSIDSASKIAKVEDGTYIIDERAIHRFRQGYARQMAAIFENIKELEISQKNLFNKLESFSVTLTPDQSLEFTTVDSPKLIEIPYYSNIGTILDNPPLFPNVNFVTYKGKDKKISPYLNSGQGSLSETPIIFSGPEEQYFRLFREANKLNDFQEILYKSDEFENLASSFEMRRMKTPPKSYEDFREVTPTIISTIYKGNQTAAAASFLDIIKPNTKYYYMFRAFDRRGTASNPTAVYQVELVENSGAIYPLIKSFEFEKKKEQVTKGIKRLFNIVPRLTQIIPKEDSNFSSLSSGINSGILGLEDNKLFGKVFKIRLTSKKTGKAVDLNIDFKSRII